MPGPTSSALLGSPFARPGNILPGAPTYSDAPLVAASTMIATASMSAVPLPPVIHTLSVTVTMVASQPWTKWADHLHAKAFS